MTAPDSIQLAQSSVMTSGSGIPSRRRVLSSLIGLPLAVSFGGSQLAACGGSEAPATLDLTEDARKPRPTPTPTPTPAPSEPTPNTLPANTVDVVGVTALHAALDNANATGGNVTLRLADGIYDVQRTLQVNAANIAIVSQSGRRGAVVLQGDAMSSSAAIKNVIRVAASAFTLKSVTVQRCGWHTVQIAGESNADTPNLIDCVFRDSWEQLVKISTTSPPSSTIFCDGGIVDSCLFEYSAGIGPQYYIAGIDGHNCKNWVVRASTFKYIASPSQQVAEQAVHFWGTGNITVDRNVFIDCDRAIQFGLGTSRSVDGGVIRNNFIYHGNNGHPFADVGISLESSPNVTVANNTVFQEHAYPRAIEFRFAGTTGGTIANNLTNRAISSRDGGTATLRTNHSAATAAMFVQASTGNLRLAYAVPGVVDSGTTLSAVTVDIDGRSRPRGSAFDIGGHEF